MTDIIIIGGAPGTGKSTIGELLREKEGFPLMDFGWLRQGHLDNKWSNSSEEEESMAFENLLFIVQNYLKHGYKNIVLTDFTEERIAKLPEIFKDYQFKIISLIITDGKEHAARVSGERDSGFKNVEEALEWNRRLMERELLPNEIRIDNTQRNPEEIVKKILELV